MKKDIVFTEKAPAPIGPYSQAIKASGNFIFISGQIPYDGDGALAGGEIKSQTHQCLKNIIAVLEEAGLNADNLVKTTVLMKNMDDFPVMNEIYNEYLGESKPARAAYQVSKLPKDVLIEIEAIAVY